MYLIFDTETTGLPKKWNAPVTDSDNWPRCIQLAWQLHDDSGKLSSSNSFQDNVALHKNELLLYDGIYTNDASYYVDYRNTYNLQVDGSHLGDNDSKSNISWKDENNNDIDFKWALFRFDNTIQSAGNAEWFT